jgi:hypothetical protein
VSVYHARRRTLIVQAGGQLSFPSVVELRFKLVPGEPFGVGDGPSQTVRLGSTARMTFDANSGRQNVVSDPPVERVVIDMDLEDDLRVRFDGNEMFLTTSCSNMEKLGQLIDWAESVVPAFLAIEFVDAPGVSEISGDAGEVHFSVQYVGGSGTFDAVTVEIQHERLLKTFRRLERREADRDRRLMVALKHFRAATRLEQVGYMPWEFMSEIILNYAKMLEVLFPAGQMIEGARAGLRELGYSDSEIEKWFIPALALRSNLDVAHVSLASFELTKLEGIQGYLEGASVKLRELLTRILGRFDAGEYVLPPYVPSAHSGTADSVLRRIAENFSTGRADPLA